MAKFETIELTASDSVKLKADWYRGDLTVTQGKPKWFVFIHMMPATKESWQAVATRAQEKGYASLAVDLRGHGQSEGGPDGYKNFTDAQHQQSRLDLQAAVDYVLGQGAAPDKIVLVGASFGANLVLEYGVNHPQFTRLILLSPGLNYRGIETEPLVQKLQRGQRIWLVAADDDNDGLNSQWAKQLFELIDADKIEKRGVTFKVAGHGSDILKAVPEMLVKVVSF